MSMCECGCDNPECEYCSDPDSEYCCYADSEEWEPDKK